MTGLQCALPLRLGALVLFLITVVPCSTHAQTTNAPFPGKHSVWFGFDRYDFEVGGKAVLVVTPKLTAPGRPWVWHGEFFGHKPNPDIALLGRGFHVVYMSVPDMLGSPKAVAYWNTFYKELTEKYGLAPKAALVGLSRGGLYCYNWAAANPEKVPVSTAMPQFATSKAGPVDLAKAKGAMQIGSSFCLFMTSNPTTKPKVIERIRSITSPVSSQPKFRSCTFSAMPMKSFPGRRTLASSQAAIRNLAARLL